MTITCSRAQSKNDRSSGARSRTRPRVGAGGRWWVAGWMLLAIVGRRCGDASALGPASWQWSQQRRWGACSWFSSLAGSGETEIRERKNQDDRRNTRAGDEGSLQRRPEDHPNTRTRSFPCQDATPRARHATLSMRHPHRQPDSHQNQHTKTAQHTHSLPGLQIPGWPPCTVDTAPISKSALAGAKPGIGPVKRARDLAYFVLI